MLHSPTHFHCYFSPPHHCLEASGGLSFRLLQHTDGEMQHTENQNLDTIPTWLAASVNAGTYKYCCAALRGEVVHCGRPFPGCRSYRTSLQKAFTTLQLHEEPSPTAANDDMQHAHAMHVAVVEVDCQQRILKPEIWMRSSSVAWSYQEVAYLVQSPSDWARCLGSVFSRRDIGSV